MKVFKNWLWWDTVVHICDYTENHKIVHFKCKILQYVDYSEWYLDKAVFYCFFGFGFVCFFAKELGKKIIAFSLHICWTSE